MTGIGISLAELMLRRARSRVTRTVSRLRSPRRLVASVLGVAVFMLYVANGILILSTRQPADPDQLRLWLSGGMVLYAIYHAVRSAWSTELVSFEWTPAESLWLGGAPIRRSTLAVYHVASMAPAAAIKTLLLVVVLAIDAGRFELLVVGVFAALMLLEIVRLTITTWASGLDARWRIGFRVAATTIAIAVVAQMISRVVAITPSGAPMPTWIIHTFQSVGQTAGCDAIQWLSMLWIPAAELAVAQGYGLGTLIKIVAVALSLPASVACLIAVDGRRVASEIDREKACLARGDYRTRASEADETGYQSQPAASPSIADAWWNRLAPKAIRESRFRDRLGLMHRQWTSVRSYAGTIGFSFLVPTLLCLSPLVTGRIADQWFFVVGGIALCTVLLAPPALRLDFRRDVKRMVLLRSLPVDSLSMVLSQILIPILITCIFQWLTISIAAFVTRPGWTAMIMWTGMMNALAVFTFAIENALFLAYPHHERAQGVAMMLRAKLTFLGKGAGLLAAMFLLALWATTVTRYFPAPVQAIALVGGAILGSWAAAAMAIAATTWCWRRFDLTLDIPLE